MNFVQRCVLCLNEEVEKVDEEEEHGLNCVAMKLSDDQREREREKWIRY